MECLKRVSREAMIWRRMTRPSWEMVRESIDESNSFEGVYKYDGDSQSREMTVVARLLTDIVSTNCSTWLAMLCRPGVGFRYRCITLYIPYSITDHGVIENESCTTESADTHCKMHEVSSH